MEELIKIFEEELKIYQELLKISKDKTDIIKERRAKELEASSRNEEGLVADVIDLEKKRIVSIKKICKQYGKEEKAMKVDELCEFIDEGKEELQTLKKDIKNVLRELKKVNNLNDALLKNSLEYVNFALSIATGSHKSNMIYEARGQKVTKGQSNNIFDIKL